MVFKATLLVVFIGLSLADVSKPKFTSRLVAKTVSHLEGNFIFSPFSVLANLGLLYQGASGHTNDVFTTNLRVSGARNFSELFHRILTSLNNAEGVTLETASKLLIAAKFKLDQRFKDVARGRFSTEVEDVDFSQQAEMAINDWIKDKTGGSTEKLVSQNDFDELTSMVMLSVIHFKSEWLYKFSGRSISNFFLNESESKKVEVMKLRANLGYAEDADLDAKILELPYKNKKLAMVIVLPNRKSGIGELQQKLSTFNIDEVLSNMIVSSVLVTLPKFKIESIFDLQQPLSEIGLGEIFTKEANFSKMLESKSDSEGLYVSKIAQRACVDVGEEGSEKAAATALIKHARKRDAKSQPPHAFIADHPFLFFIVYRQKLGAGILFVGRVTQL